MNEIFKNTQDVYYLVGSIINRQTGKFSKEEIIKKTKRELKKTKLKNVNIKNIVDKELEILFRNNFVKIIEGKFIYNDDFSVI